MIDFQILGPKYVVCVRSSRTVTETFVREIFLQPVGVISVTVLLPNETLVARTVVCTHLVGAHFRWRASVRMVAFVDVNFKRNITLRARDSYAELVARERDYLVVMDVQDPILVGVGPNNSAAGVELADANCFEWR